MPQMEINMKTIRYSFYSLALIFALVSPIAADTIRLKDGSVIRGTVVGFKDQQFTVLIGSGSQGRRSRTLIYVEDVESIEFDSVGASVPNTSPADDRTADNSSTPDYQPPRNPPPRPTATPTPNSN